ncbi:MAG: hypothetical protein IJ333_01270 [Clostridia bacterium]|nr:hypothetical protein [Clostridia bacterium]
MDFWKQSNQNIYVAAHRGWCSHYPENTMEAFIAAEKIGVDQIETDVRVTRDGELVLIHDAAVDRTTNGTGLVCEKTLAELKALDAGSYRGSQFKDCRIPTFIEFMEYFKDHPTMTLDLELKEYPVEGREALAYEVCDRVLQMVEEYGFADRIVINSFSGKLQEYIYKKYGKKYRQHVFYPLKYMGECAVDPYAYAYCCCMLKEEEGRRMASKEAFEQMLSRGVQPWVGASVQDEEGVEEAIRSGAYLITCNNPDRILAILREKGYHA